MKKMLKKMVIAMLAVLPVVALLGSPALAADTASFSDVSSSASYSEAVGYLASQGAVTGYSDGSFRPDDAVTYSDMVAALVKVSGANVETSQYASYSYQHGWSSNSEFTIYGSGIAKTATRQAGARILVGYLGVTPYDYRMYTTASYADESSATEVYTTNYRDYVRAGYELGLFTADANGRFNPTASLTRGDFCEALYRIVKGTVSASSYSAPGVYGEVSIVTADSADADDVRVTRNKLVSIPRNVLESYVKNSWKIVITSEDTVNKYYASSKTVRGITDLNTRTIYVPASCGKDVLAHEIGHYVQHNMGAASGLSRAYSDEASKVSNYATTSTEEFFAESFAKTVIYDYIGTSTFSSACPESWAMVHSVIG